MADPRWVSETMERYEAQLVRYAFRITLDLERARDVVQDTFIRLWEADRTELDGSLAAWLFTVCRNRALDVIRKDRRMVSLTEAEEISAPSPEAESKADARTMLEALGRLPARQQEVLRLKFQNGLSYKEISAVTGLSVSNVGFVIHTGVMTLRRYRHD